MELGQTLLEELAAEQGEEAKSILSDNVLTDHEEDWPSPSQPTLYVNPHTLASLPAKRPVKVRHKAVRKSLNITIGQPEQSTSHSTLSRLEEPRNAGLPPQLVWISSILRYYREAETKSHHPQPFSLPNSTLPPSRISTFSTLEGGKRWKGRKCRRTCAFAGEQKSAISRRGQLR